MRKAKRVLVLVHPQYHPRPGGRKDAPTEYDVWTALRRLGHEVDIAPVENQLRAFDRVLRETRPDLVFNLLEEFRGEAVYDFHIISYLEALGIAYTGCNPRALILTRNKLWTAHIARAEGVEVPDTRLAGPRPPKHYPALMKYNREHASLGMTAANVVRNSHQYTRTFKRLRAHFEGEKLVQSFIPGQEVSVAVWGNERTQAFPPWQLHLPGRHAIATAKVKFDSGYRRKQGIRAARFADVRAGRRLQSEARKLFTRLDMNGYARFDFRLDAQGAAYLIDVNANPCLAKTEDFACAARSRGYSYEDVIQKVVSLGLRYEPRR